MAAVWHKSRDLIVKHKLLRICTYQEIECGSKQLTICNSWRIHRSLDNEVTTFEYNFATALWEPCSDYSSWPNIRLFSQGMACEGIIIRSTLFKVLNSSGFNDLTELQAQRNGKQSMQPYQLEKALVQRYLRTGKNRKTVASRFDFSTGCRALYAALWQHILDKQVMSAMGVINRSPLTLHEYLVYSRHREGLLKVSSERRNLLPILPLIHPTHWLRPDLFSRKLWVRDGRKSTALDRKPVRLSNKLSSFKSASAWNWLSKASPVIVRAWADSTSNNLLLNIALANINLKIPVNAYVFLFRTVHLRTLDVCPQAQAFLRLYASHCANLWRDEGFTGFSRWLKVSAPNEMSDLLDYLSAEGFARSFPNKHSTWSSLRRRSHDWHQRVYLESLQIREKLEWKSVLPETVIDEIVFVPLTSSYDLALEGFHLKHCIGGQDYINYCFRGFYRAFSVTEACGTRSTLGLRLDQKDKNTVKVVVDQQRGIMNSEPSNPALKAGEKLATLYQKTLSNNKFETATLST